MKTKLSKATLLWTLLGLYHSAGAQGQALTFSVMADIPYGSTEVEVLQQHVDEHNLYSPSEFIVHLGDIKSGSGSCSQSVYSDMAANLKGLKVPAYIIPGDNEYNDCSNPTQAWGYWETHLGDFEQNFCGVPSTLERQSVRHENFAFTLNGVLLIGLNLVGGSVHDQSEWNTRMQQDADWVSQQFQEKGSQVRAAVVFGHAGPDSKRDLFFDQFEQAAIAFDKPVLYMHGDGHSWVKDNPFSAQNITRVEVDDGGSSVLPVQVTVEINSQTMFAFERNPWSSSSQAYNMPPCVEAGPNQSITLPAVASLEGSATDDGDPPSLLTVAWSVVSGPGTVEFASPQSQSTTASFSNIGTYVLRLTANDGQLEKYDELTVQVSSQGPVLSINDVSVNEGDAGTVDAVFTVTLAAGDGQDVWVDYTSADGSANQGDDYSSAAGTLIFSGGATTQTITVRVNGDLLAEPNENFFVNLSNALNASITDGQGLGTITDDDGPPPPSISSFDPASGWEGTEVTIGGSGFTGASSVKFNGVAATTFAVDNDGQIRANVPSGATTGKISVTNGGGTAESADNFTVNPAPATVLPSEDSYVKSSSPTSNYGTASTLRVRQSSSETLNAYLKFEVSGLSGTVQSAKLRLYVTDAGPDGGSVYVVSNDQQGTSTPWTQANLNWNTAPAISGTALSAAGAVVVSTWIELDVTAAFGGDGTYSFGLTSTSSDVVYYSSKEGSNKPELVIEVGSGPPPPPTITSFTPSSGLVGTEVTINGSQFSGANSVTFNGTAATFVVDSSTKIRANVPSGAASGKIRVTTGNGTAESADDFTVTQPPPLPAISGFSPSSGTEGVEVTISGSGFTGASSVKFNGVAATTFAVDNDGQIRANVPSGATTGAISVTTANGTGTSADNFTVIPPPPTISSFSPNNGQPGTGVTINGTNFINVTQVAFNGAASSFTVTSSTQILATVPSGSTTGKISVTNTGGTASSADDFIVTAGPMTFLPSDDAYVKSTSPTKNYGTSSTVRVRQSGSETQNAYLKFEVSGLSGTVQSAKLRLYVTDAGPDGGSVYVVSNYQQGTSTPWTQANLNWNTAPAISGTALSAAGAVVKSTWIELDMTAAFGGDGTYSFGLTSTSSDVVYYSSKEGSNKPELVIEVGSGPPPPPTITSFTPSSGLVGTEVTINGSQFSGANSVTFNGTAATFVVDSSTKIRANVPSGAASGKIRVTTGNGTAESADDFTVTQPPPPPTISGFSPSSGTEGVEVTISGSGFTGASSVKFNGVAATTFAVDNDGQIRANVPSGATTGKISVTTSGGTAQSTNDFTVTPLPPAITSFTPSSGSVGTEVTINGNNFTGASSVKFNGTAATFTVDSSTKIRANVAVDATSGKISVTTGGGTAESAGNFTVTPPPIITSFAPTDDAITYSAGPTQNYGADLQIGMIKTSTYEIYSYLKFNVSGLSGAVQSAKLRLYVDDGSTDGGSIFSVSNNYQNSSDPWIESTIVWNNAPLLSGSPLGALGTVAVGTTVEFVVSSAITGDGTYSFGLKNGTNNLVKYSSKEGAHPPELVIETVTGVAPVAQEPAFDEMAAPAHITVLYPGHPNPFNAQIAIEYDLPKESKVRLTVYNLLSQEIRTLVDATQTAGHQRAMWDGKNQQGESVSSGVYFFQLQAGANRLIGKMVLQK